MKKIFCIFAVVLILIMATVPCFALSSGYYNFENIVTGRIFYTYGDLTYQNQFPKSLSLVFHSINSTTWQNSVSITFNGFRSNHRYFIYLNVPFHTIIQLPQTTGGSFSVSPSVPYAVKQFGTVNNDYFLLYPSSLNINIETEYIFTNFYIIDITDMFDSSYTDEDIFDYFNQFIDFENFQSDGVLYNKGFSNFTGFYSNLSHVFEPVWSFFDNWSFVTVFVVGSFFICLMIFIVALIIRRCRNV